MTLIADDIPIEFWQAHQAATQLQERIRASKYIPFEPTVKQWQFLLDERREILLGGSAGPGKLLADCTPVLTVNGWTTHGELSVGDEVFDENGNPTVIRAVHLPRRDPMFRIVLSNGAELVAHPNHLWDVLLEADAQSFYRRSPEFKARRRAKRPSRSLGADSLRSPNIGLSSARRNAEKAAAARLQDELPNVWDFTRTVSTVELLELLKTERRAIRIPMGAALQTTGKWEHVVEPYRLGYWLGDGGFKTGKLYCAELDIEHAREQFPDLVWKDDEQLSRAQKFYGSNRTVPSWVPKEIPSTAWTASYEDRLALFQGIMDTDGYTDAHGGCGLAMAREELLRDIWKLAHTLGLNPAPVHYKPTTNQDPDFRGHSWRFGFTTPVPVFRLPRKSARQKYVTNRVGGGVSIVSITPCEPELGRCLTVANPLGLYRVGYEQIVTHNSVGLLMSALAYVDDPSYRALLFRRTYADLRLSGALVDLADSWLGPTDAKRGTNGLSWKFPSGATLTFAYLANEAQKYRYQSSAYHFCGFDELSQFTQSQYLYLFTRVRRQKHTHIPLRVRSATNPGGVGHEWVKQRFLKQRKSNRLFIPARMSDNEHLDVPAYRAMLRELDPVTRRQLEHGDWDIAAAGNIFAVDQLTVVSSDESDVDWRHPRIRRVRAWDMAATASPTADWCVGCRVAYDPRAKKYAVEDIVRVRQEPGMIEQTLQHTAAIDGPHVTQVVEQEPGSAGKLALRHLRTTAFEGLPVIPIRPFKDKVSRARLAASLIANGDFEVRSEPWTPSFINELRAFPQAGIPDDTCDALAHAVTFLAGNSNMRPPTAPTGTRHDLPEEPRTVQASTTIKRAPVGAASSAGSIYQRRFR